MVAVVGFKEDKAQVSLFLERTWMKIEWMSYGGQKAKQKQNIK